MRYWFEEENFALVQKGRKDYGALNDKEKQKFEYYIDTVRAQNAKMQIFLQEHIQDLIGEVHLQNILIP